MVRTLRAGIIPPKGELQGVRRELIETYENFRKDGYLICSKLKEFEIKSKL